MLKKNIYYLFLFTILFSFLLNASVDLWVLTLIRLFSLIILVLSIFFILNKFSNYKKLFIYCKTLLLSFPLKKEIILLFIVSFLSYLFAINRFNSLNEFYNIVNYIFFFSVVVFILNSSQLKKLIIFLIWESFFLCIYVFFQIFYSQPITATFINANIFAGYLVMMIPLTLGTYIKSKREYKIIKKFTKKPFITLYRLLFIQFFILLFILLLTKSLGGIIAVFFSLLIYFFLTDNLTKKKKICFYSIGFLLSILVINKLVNTEFYNRLHWWIASLKMFKDFPVLGIGLGNFIDIYPIYKAGTLSTIYPHSFFLKILSENGILGLIPYILILLFLFKITKYYKTEKKHLYKIELPSIIASLWGTILLNIFDYSLIIPSISILFWVLFGILCHYLSLPEKYILYKKSLSNKELRVGTIYKNQKRVIKGLSLIIAVLLLKTILIPFLSSKQWAEGNYIFKNKQNLSVAEEKFIKAIELMPTNPYYYLSLSQLYLSYYLKEREKNYLDEALFTIERFKKFRYILPMKNTYTILTRLKSNEK